MRCRATVVALLLAAAGAACAQVAPSAAEQAAYTGVLAAAWRGDAAALARADAAALRLRDARGRTALHIATHAKRHAAIRALAAASAAAGADLGALDADRYDAVTIAAVANDEVTLALLLRLGASAKRTTSRWDGTALIAAAHEGHEGVVRLLIAAGAPLDHVNNLHWTALIEAVVLGDGGPRHQGVVQALLAAGADARLADRDGRTPLQLAEARGYTAIAALLREAAGR